MWWFMLLGHLTGDYLMQTDVQARYKSKRGIQGHLVCLIHCWVYASTVMLFVVASTRDPLSIPLMRLAQMFLMIMLTHYPIDRWSLARWWLSSIGRRPPGPTIHDAMDGVYWLVYVVVDNTMHLLLMTVGFMAFFPEFI